MILLLGVGCSQPPELKEAAPIKEGPLRVLFLGHDSEQHPSDEYYPMLAQALGLWLLTALGVQRSGSDKRTPFAGIVSGA